MKKWSRPMTFVQKFEANEYVAACGDENRVYKFECTAGGGVPGTVWEDTNGNGEWDIIGDECLTTLFGIFESYHACGATHEAPTTDDFTNGFFLPGADPSQRKDVIIWKGEDGNNIHCTENISMDTWETAKS